MHDKWISGFVALVVFGSTACQKETAPAPSASTQTVTQSAKPVETPAGATAAPAQPAASAPSSASATSASTVELKVGEPAPPVKLTLQNGNTIDLGSLKGKQTVVYFYPKDDTPGCTVEAQGIRDHWEAFQKAGIEVFGVSLQDAASHTAFIDKHKLPFNLVVDSDKKVTEAFGVPVRGGEFAARQTFLIGTDGNIKQIWREVTPSEHARQVLEAAGASPLPSGTSAQPKAG